MDVFRPYGLSRRNVKVKWNLDEEHALLECMEISVHRELMRGLGNYRRIEQLFNVKCPGKNPGMLAIRSKINIFMKGYYAISDMLAHGFAMEHDTNKIVGPDELWNAWLETNPHHAWVKTREFPHYNWLNDIIVYRRQQEENDAAAVENEAEPNPNNLADMENID